MNKLFIKLFIFFILIVFINNALRFSVQYFLNLSSTPELDYKLEKAKSKNCNTYLVGSSMTYYSINPIGLNSFKVKNQLISSFNFGLTGQRFPKTYYIIDDLLNKSIPKPKLILVEINYYENVFDSEISSLFDESLIEIYYKLSLFEFYDFFKHKLNSSFEWLNKSFFRDNVQFNIKSENGFVTEDQLCRIVPGYISKHLKYLKTDTAKIYVNDPRKKMKNLIDSKEKKILNVYINSIIKIAKHNNCKIFFYLPNRISHEHAKVIIPVFNSLSDSIKFNPNLNPNFGQLMQPKYSWDLAHLNEMGAEIYSKIFAEEFKKQIVDKGYLNN